MRIKRMQSVRTDIVRLTNASVDAQRDPGEKKA